MIYLIILAVVIVFLVGLYNTLIAKKNQANDAFASVDVQLKQRYDLIPNLVSAVKEYMKHEAKVLEEITEMRSKAVSGNLSDDQKIELDTRMSKAIGGLMVAVENYPDLKANQNFLQLQASLNEVEEKIAAARRAYNAAVKELNNAIEMFPTNMVASTMGLQQRQWFETDEESRKNVNVKDMFQS